MNDHPSGKGRWRSLSRSSTRRRAGQIEVLAGERTRTVKAELSRDQELICPPVQKFWDDAVKGAG